jgi:predicted MPP superfamily phosphohydrolase
MGYFLRILVGVTLVMHVPAAIAIAELARRADAPAPAAIGVAYAALGMVLFVARARAGRPDRRKHPWLVRLLDVPYFVHWCACVWTLIPSLLAMLVAPFVDLARAEPAHLPSGFILWTYASGIAVATYGTLVRRRVFQVKEVELPVRGLDARFDGFRIAHLSDLHIGSMTPRAWGERWTRAANLRAPDLAVVTGDMVTSGHDYHDDVADVVGGLRAKEGVFVSMGNHDYFGDGEPLVAKLAAKGARVLRNEGTVLERGGASLYLAAIDDTWTKRDDMGRALEGRPRGAKTILLAHDPERFPAAAERGVDVVLSGHTHGGQIAVPFLYRWLSLASISHRFNVGLYRLGDALLYVSPGLGTTGPPMRLGTAPAVVMLTLRAA